MTSTLAKLLSFQKKSGFTFSFTVVVTLRGEKHKKQVTRHQKIASLEIANLKERLLSAMRLEK